MGAWRAVGVALAVAAVAAVARAGGGAPARVETVAEPSSCAVAGGPLSYQWPIKPFHSPHPVRGNFGDPRTIFELGSGGHFSFHNGVDIVAPDGTPVFPVVSGVVAELDPDLLIVRTDDGRRFQYYHLVPVVSRGRRVRRGTTVLGYVRPGAGHVHLTEIRDAIVQNPLAPGHLTPYVDSTPPEVRAVSFLDAAGKQLSPRRLQGGVEIVADALDRPSLPVPAPWNGLPVAPAALAWQVESPDGRAVVPERVTIDFRESEPHDDQFWNVYVRGTLQNFAAVGRRYLFGHPGTYLYDVTPQPFDTRLLPSGSYVLTVTALDVCGNTGALRVPIRILPQARPLPLPKLPRRAGLATWPARLSAYTVVLASVPRSEGRREALAVAERARAAGLRESGTFLSSGFASLQPGYWVAFSCASASVA